MPEDEVLTTPEAASLLKIPIRTLQYLVQTSQVPYSRVGKRLLRFSRERLLQWVREQEGVELRYNTAKKAKAQG